jgi:flagellar motor protein MotB
VNDDYLDRIIARVRQTHSYIDIDGFPDDVPLWAEEYRDDWRRVTRAFVAAIEAEQSP